jgi:hypothetical protein
METIWCPLWKSLLNSQKLPLLRLSGYKNFKNRL